MLEIIKNHFKPDGTAFKILIVDDSEYIINQMINILGSTSYKVKDIANDGEEAFEKYKLFYPDVDLVTLDITMPKMNGIECLKKIMEFDKKAKIIIISSIDNHNVMKQCILSGAQNYIIKPIEADKVIGKIYNTLL